MESFESLIEALRKPFLFISKSEFSKLSSVKDLQKRTIELAEEGLKMTHESEKRDSFKKLIVIFQNYENLDLDKKKEAIEETLSLLQDLDGKPALIKPKEGFYIDEKHKLLTKEEYLKNDEKLSESVQYLKGVGPKIAEKFAKANIYTIGDLFYFFPRKYEDRRKMKKIEDLKEADQATFMGEIQDIHTVYYRGIRKKILEVLISDETGEVTAKWFNFNEAYFQGKVRIGAKAIFTGKIKAYRNKKEIHHPEFEALGKTDGDNLSFGRIVPIYVEIGGLYQKTLRKIMFKAIHTYSKLRTCFLPNEYCRKYDLLSPQEALLEIHFPNKFAQNLLVDENYLHTSAPYKSLIFSELFIFNLLIGLKKRTVKLKEGVPLKIEDSAFNDFISHLPYELTKSQNTVLNEIRKDLTQAIPMNRLLEGDVGSGKTVVALISAMMAIKAGHQAAFMAPTEILAEQIYNEACKLLGKENYKVELLIGAQDTKTRNKVLKGLKDGSIDLAVGTHALIQKGVDFKDLGLIIVDEQHRFGVLQRGALREKGQLPHVLVMSATPIPRTLALTYYGDLDISTITELPKGRKPIQTRLLTDQSRAKLYNFVKEELKRGRQTYIIYPIIEESKKMNLLDATGMAEYLKTNIFPSYNLELIHGRLPSDKKDRIMGKFRRGKIDVLVSTTVIEVGIDVPNATIMIIEHPERFGLSQLHQLRGRVGRGAHKSYCFLLLGLDYEDEIKERLTIFKDFHDGFKLAEEDLRLRGPGDFFGVTQSGLPPFIVSNF